MINQISPLPIADDTQVDRRFIKSLIDKINELVHERNVMLAAINVNPMVAKAYRDEYRKYHGQNPD